MPRGRIQKIPSGGSQRTVWTTLEKQLDLGSNCFLRVVLTRISKETNSYLWFSKGRNTDPFSPFWIRTCGRASCYVDQLYTIVIIPALSIYWRHPNDSLHINIKGVINKEKKMPRGRIKKFCQGGGGWCGGSCFLVINLHVFHRELCGSPSRSNWTPWGPIASWGWSLPEFLKKPIAASDFPGQVHTPCPPSGSAHVPELLVMLFSYV